MSPCKQENTLFWQEVGHKTETRTELDNGKWNRDKDRTEQWKVELQ